MAKITQLSPYMALPMKRYGSFAGKSGSGKPMDITPLTLKGRARRWRSSKFRFRRGPN